MGESDSSFVIIRGPRLALAHRHGISEVEDNERLSDEIRRLQREFIAEFAGVIPTGMTLTDVGMKTVVKEIGKEIKGVKERVPDRIVINLDPFLARYGNVSLDMTRELDPDSGSLALKNRFGSPSIDAQMLHLSAAAAARGRKTQDVVLADISSFSGNTITSIVSLLEQNGFTVKAVVLGISSEEVKAKFAEQYGNRIDVSVARIAATGIELRDLIGIDGKEVPNGTNQRLYVKYTQNPEWAGIERHMWERFIDLSEKYNRALLNVLSEHGIDTGRLGTHIPLHEEQKRKLVHR